MADGYSFSAWYDEEGSRVDEILSEMPAKNIVYTPITYSITYNVNNPYATNDNKADYTIESDTFEIVAPTSAGDRFYGRYLDANFTVVANTTIGIAEF